MTEEMKKEFIGYDTEGWPMFKLNYRSILEMLGFEHVDGKYVINDDNEMLDRYPLCLEDDGMGYGVNGKYITEVNSDGNIFIEEQQEGSENGPSFVVETLHDLRAMSGENNNDKVGNVQNNEQN